MISGEVGLKEPESKKQAWLDVLDLLDKYSLSADEVMVLAETLFDMATKHLEEETEEESELMKKEFKQSMYTTFRSPVLERFPLSKSRWGLDPSLLKEDN